MKAEDVTATLELALQASGLDQAKPALARAERQHCSSSEILGQWVN
jgi:hypothetical protein